jgi:hypothetical protein
MLKSLQDLQRDQIEAARDAQARGARIDRTARRYAIRVASPTGTAGSDCNVAMPAPET